MEIQHLTSMARQQGQYFTNVLICLHFLLLQTSGQNAQQGYVYDNSYPTPYLPNNGYEYYGGDNYEYVYQDPCEQPSSCQGRDLLFLYPEDVHLVNCFCDDQCQIYHDCCHDFVETPENEHFAKMKLKRNLFSCSYIDGVNADSPVYVVDSCPKNYLDPFFKNNCERSDQNEFFSNIPVSGDSSGILYKNYYCATCNSVKDFSFWDIDIECETHPQINPNSDNFNVHQALQRLLSFRQNDCTLLYKHKTHKERFCKQNVISKCHNDWKDKRVKKKCRASNETSHRYALQRIFRNEFCAQCNFINTTNLDCIDRITPTVPSKTHKGNIFQPFSMLLDINIGSASVNESRVGVQGIQERIETMVDMRQCEVTEIYDPFAQKCRLVRCPGGQKFTNGRCVADPNYKSLTSTTPKTTTTEQYTSVAQQTNITSAPSSTNTIKLIDPITPKHNSRTRMYLKPGTVPVLEQVTEANSGQDDNNVNVTTSSYNDTSMLTENKMKSSTKSSISGVDYNIWLMNCPVISIPKMDYQIHFDGKIYIPTYSRYYNTSEYVNDTNGDIMICIPSDKRNYTVTYNVTHRVEMFKFDKIQGLISYIGLLISILCLFVVFVIYMIYPSLRNIAGKCIVCLVVSLLLAQLSFMVGGPMREYNLACFIMGVLLHYFYLCAFCWMNILSIDILKIVSASTTRSESESNCFIYYSLYAWIVPAVIVGTTVAMDFLGDDFPEYQAQYGDGICWITQRLPLLIMFAAPVALILITNIIMFIITTIKICIASRAARYLHTDKKDKSRFLLYIKLCIIMGLTWIFGFIAAMTDLQFLWYLFIIFNTLQGAFICFAFVCTRNVFRLLSGRDKKKKSKIPTYYNSTNNHGHITSSWNKTKNTVLDTSYNGDARVIESRETSI